MSAKTTGLDDSVADLTAKEGVTYNEVIQCQFSNWYSTFSTLSKESLVNRKNITVKSIVLPLPPNFADFLLSDGVRLPEGATKVSSYVPPEKDDEWSDDDGDEKDEPEEVHQFSFPELNIEIQSAIESLGGAVMPKLNWSAPKDASWINNGTLKCQTPGDVYLLLKSSDFIMHDVQHALDAVSLFDNDGKVIKTEKVKYELVLRKWCNLHPSMEFRCFVFHDELLAISQRQHTQHFPHLTTEGMMYRSYIIDFFDSAIKGRFAGGEIPNYCFDVYIDKKDRVWILDFNVWGKQTDSLLYDWHELGRFAKNLDEELASQLEIDALDLEHGIEDENDDFVAIQSDFPEFRVVETENEIRQDPLASYRAPIDTIELASNASGKETPSFEAFMALCEKPSEIPEEDEDDQGSR